MMYPYYYGYRRYPFYNTARRDWEKDVKEQSTSYVDKENNACDNENDVTRHLDESKEDSPVFNFFGIKLYFDDLLLLALIYFLYSEDVHDPELFIALLLLLMS